MSDEGPSEKEIEEEYKIWKKNSPYLYDLAMSHSLEWPSLTVQWLPEVQTPADKNVSINKMVLGTHTEDGASREPNYLMIAEVALPLPGTEIDVRRYDDEKQEVGGYGGLLNKIEIKIRMAHDGEVNRARVMPQNTFVIATKSPSSTVYVFDYSKHGSMPPDSVCRPQYRLLGHEKEGFGLSWNPHTAGHLISGSHDSLICMWDINANHTSSSLPGISVNPLQVRRGHTKEVEDVDWHKHNAHLFGSIGDDSRLLIWDARDACSKPSYDIVACEDEDGTTISFNPYNEFLLATGASDGIVRLWDMRKLKAPMHLLEGHKDAVYSLAWAPFNETILASCGADRRVNIWDLSRIGAEQDPEDAEDGPPELLFVHGGHTSKVSDISWNVNDHWTIASVAEDNILQVWQLSESIYNDEDEEEEGDDDEEEEDDDDGDDEPGHDTKKQRQK